MQSYKKIQKFHRLYWEFGEGRGDGALLMHMGSLAISASMKCENFKHILFNNGSHDSVGGQPTVGYNINIQTRF